MPFLNRLSNASLINRNNFKWKHYCQCTTQQIRSISWQNNDYNNTDNGGKLYRWNDVLFSSTFNEIVQTNDFDLTQYSLFREKNFIKSFDKGFFSLMPFVVRSLERLIELIESHMYQLGAQKVITPSLVGKHLWIKSGRWEDSGQDLFRLIDRHKNQYCLAPTHEEVITQILASCSQLSHRQLPIYLYQISPKYRDELRTKFGLLRAREFVMKDLYTFDKSEEAAKETYQKICSTYENLFKLLELPAIKTVGSVGTIGGKHSHEFLLETNLGEDEIYTCSDCLESFNAELLDESTLSQSSTVHCPNCKSPRLLPKKRALELGHSFLLCDRYSSKMGAFYLSESNKPIALQMGCYGLGVSRILAASVEYLSLKHQPLPKEPALESDPTTATYSQSSIQTNLTFLRWPRLLVPFKICLLLPKRDSKEDHGKGTEFSMHLARIIREKFKEDILIDDRSNLTIGKRLLTAKTIGIPFIIVAGKNIIDMRPKFELFDMYSDGDPRTKQPVLMTQKELLNYLNVHLKEFKKP